MKQKIQDTIRQWEGPLTQELVRTPGKFGLGQVPLKLSPDGVTTTICGFCSTGCSLKAHLVNGEAVNLSPNTDYPVNLGMACPKGWESLTPLQSKDRATTPLLKNSSGKWDKVSWDKGLTHFCDKIKATQEKYGEDSVAFISTGQIPTEEMAALGMLTKFGMGIKHGDGNTRQCMATAVVAYKQSFGFDAPPYTYQDFEESDVLVFVGANPCIAHPIMWERVMRNPHNPEIIVIDPRRTETASCAHQHLALAPKSDLFLFYTIAHELITQGYIDHEFLHNHTEHFNAFAKFTQDYTIEEATRQSGLSAESIQKVVQSIGLGKRVSLWWTMGVNQSYEGVRLAQSLINIALMTGNIGRPGTGANSITGQCNAMGSRLFSNTTGLLGGHDFTNESHRTKVADILNIDVNKIPSENSLAYDQIMERVSQGKIKALWVIATNNAHSWIAQSGFKETLKNLDFLAVQDMYYNTETAEIADMVLPAAAWGEKEGTFINSERRFGRIKRISKSPGQSLADFYIFKLIANYWGCPEILEPYATPESLFLKLRDLTVDQPNDITGIPSFDFIEKNGGIQWPFTSKDSVENKQRRLFEDNQFYTPTGKAQFLFEAPKRKPEVPDKSFPFVLLTGRGTSAQWHTQTRTSKSPVLQKLYPKDAYIEMHPDAAKALAIRPNESVIVRSRRGKMKVKVNVTPTIQPDQIFIPMHYKETNQLTFPSFDSYSRQPSYKYCAVAVEKIRYWED